MRLHRPRRFPAAALAAVGLLCALTSCGTTSTPSPTNAPTSGAPTAAATTTAPPTTSAEPSEACADVAALSSSLEALTKVRPTQDGVSTLTTAIADVKTNLDAAEASASPALQPSIQQVKTAFAGLQEAASGLTADNLGEKAPAISSATREVANSTAALRTKLAESCPGI